MITHNVRMIIGCLLPLLLIFVLPLFGVGSGVTLFIFIILMFGCHLMMMGGHGKHGHSEHGHSEHEKGEHDKAEHNKGADHEYH